MSDVRCSARPSDLYAAAAETAELASALRAALAALDGSAELVLLSARGFWSALAWRDPLWSLVDAVDDLSLFVAAVGRAFERAGDGTATHVVTTGAAAIDGWLQASAWLPADHLHAAREGEWGTAVFGTRCASWPDAGYLGTGFVVGPDGRRYPLVAPWVTRGGVVYQADDGVLPGRPNVLDLDGRDPGWTTLYERTGIERWRAAPDLAERTLIGIGATAAGAPMGSTEADVQTVTIVPGRAPVLGASPGAGAPSAVSPPAYEPDRPEYPPPNAPDVAYPRGQDSLVANGAALAPLFIDGLGGAVFADLGSHDAYDIAFQQNVDGRVRAVYRRVFVGTDAGGDPVLQSVYVTGPERNDQVAITYAPR